MLQINGLCKNFSEKQVLKGIDLHVQPGDIYGFIGANGAGKTTTIKCATGILPFSEGEILVCGKSIKENPLWCKQQMAYIPDNPDLYEYLTGISYLNFVADVFGVPQETRKARIEEYAKKFGIFSNLGDAIESYSHGMKQKLVIISALLHAPKLLILDEPFVGLDPSASHLLKQIMQELLAQGAAIFFSTHVLEVAEKICNKIAILKDGKIIVSGKTEEIVGNASLEHIFLELTDHDA